MIKKLILLFILIIPLSFAREETFTTNINVYLYNGTVNVTTEQDVHTYDCMSNSSQGYILKIKRNTTQEAIELSSTLNNFTGNVNNLLSTCEQITKQYGDVNTYFKLYATCNTDLTLCNKEKEGQKNQITDLSPFKAQSETCSNTLIKTQNSLNEYSNIVIPSIQSNLSLMATQVNNLENSKWFYFMIGGVIVGVIFIYRESQKTKVTQREKTIGLQGRSHGR